MLTWETVEQLGNDAPITTPFELEIVSIYDGKSGDGQHGPWAYVRMLAADSTGNKNYLQVWDRSPEPSHLAGDFQQWQGRKVHVMAKKTQRGWGGCVSKWYQSKFQGVKVNSDLLVMNGSESASGPEEPRSHSGGTQGRPAQKSPSSGQQRPSGGKLSPDSWTQVAVHAAARLSKAPVVGQDPAAVASLVATLMISIGRGETLVGDLDLALGQAGREREPGEDEGVGEDIPF